MYVTFMKKEEDHLKTTFKILVSTLVTLLAMVLVFYSFVHAREFSIILLTLFVGGSFLLMGVVGVLALFTFVFKWISEKI